MIAPAADCNIRHIRECEGMKEPLKNPKNNYKQYEKLPPLLHFLDTISNLLASVTGVCASGVCAFCFSN